MPNLDDLKSSFSRKLDARKAQHEIDLQAELRELRQRLQRAVAPTLVGEAAHRLQDLDQRLLAPKRETTGSAPAMLKIPALVSIGQLDQLLQLDRAFWEHFQLGEHYPAHKLQYKTEYCETLPEFFRPLVEIQDLSPQAQEIQLGSMVREAEDFARQTHGGGTFGFNLPGQGCYLNGWLFVYGFGITPRQAFDDQNLLAGILGTAAHEKLGHGFLDLYTAMGEVKSQLGLGLAEIASRFGLRTADDPVSSLRIEQHNLLFTASQLLEEGWATWLQHYLGEMLLGATSHPRHTLQSIWKATVDLPEDLPERQPVQEALQTSLAVLFDEHAQPDTTIHTAVRIIERLGSQLDEHFSRALHQPLRYAVGEMLFAQAEHNLGAFCAPYVAIIAANLTFNPAQISLTDLASLLARDPRLNPDTRLACLSRLHLRQMDSLNELVDQAQAELSYSVPPEIR